MDTNSGAAPFGAEMQGRSGAAFYEAVKVALWSLNSSKLRSFLTLLGIILATATLIAVMGVIHGMDVYIAQQVTSMGSDGFRVRRVAALGQVDPKRLIEILQKNPQLTREEFEFLRTHATLVRDMAMEIYRGVTVRLGNDALHDVQLQGVTANLPNIVKIEPELGRFFTEGEDQRRQPVAFIGQDVYEKFFLGMDPLGKKIYLDGKQFEVIGVSKKLGSVFGQSRDNFVIIPIETCVKSFGGRQGLGYAAAAISRENLNSAQDEIRSLMRAYRKLKPNQEDNFGMVSSDALVAVWDQLTSVIAATAVAIVSVFMVVGGVVVMNIMLAVVTERTHEIGVRKSVGARKQDILSQFLVESSLLAAAGGLLGVILAWIVAVIVRNTTPVPVQLPPSSIFVGVGLSAAVGLFFGVYPARRAAQMDPIEALRYEK